jgi:D-alanine-D-alanine ligase
MARTPIVAVLMGGTSSEREISLRTGAAMAHAIASRGYRVLGVDLQTETLREIDGLKFDAAVIAMHGRFGEDGTLQKMLDRRGIPYSGSGPEASRLAMDKVEAKRMFKARGIDTPDWRLLVYGDSVDVLEAGARSLGYPVVIKPKSEGSSVGVSLHRDKTTVFEGAIEAFRFERIAMMERFVEGREMTVGILDGQPLPPIELKPKRAFFDYTAKYGDPDTQYLVDPPMDEDDRRRVQQAALAAHKALGCEGATRVDIIFTPLHTAFVLEVNTIPGMTQRSLLPKAASAIGISYAELCEKILKHAMSKRRGFFRSLGVAAAL